MVGFSDGMVGFSDEADILSGGTGHPYGIKVLRRSLRCDLIRQLKQTAKNSALNKRIA